jgi:adenylate cyclase
MFKRLSPENSLKLKQLLLIVLYWVTMVRIVVSLEFYGLDGKLGNLHDTNLFTVLQQNMIAATLSGFAIGLLTGLAELFVFQKYFRNRSILRLILAKTLVYFVSISLISVFAAFLFHRHYRGRDVMESVYAVLHMLNTNGYFHVLIIGLLLSLGINFVLILQSQVGIGSFLPILLGRYHQPKEEERIFLFLDLRSSTQMAEELGHKKYSHMIQSCFRDLSSLVIRHRGVIYQFVGDEAVITWKTKKEENYLHGVQLFFAFRELLESRSEYYLQRFGLEPQFKGAVNAGKVMVAEVGGSIKSEIAFHGDVLNTASRLMELCNVYSQDLMISESVCSHLPPNLTDLDIRMQGQIKLRGKNIRVNIFGVEKKDEPLVIPSPT